MAAVRLPRAALLVSLTEKAYGPRPRSPRVGLHHSTPDSAGFFPTTVVPTLYFGFSQRFQRFLFPRFRSPLPAEATEGTPFADALGWVLRWEARPPLPGWIHPCSLDRRKGRAPEAVT